MDVSFYCPKCSKTTDDCRCKYTERITALETELAEALAENERLREAAERWWVCDNAVDITPFLREYHSGVGLSIDAIDAERDRYKANDTVTETGANHE